MSRNNFLLFISVISGVDLKGATTISIMKLIITTFSTFTLSIMSLSIITLSITHNNNTLIIMALIIMALIIMALIIRDIQNTNSQLNLLVAECHIFLLF
jgi:hypothetical protein